MRDTRWSRFLTGIVARENSPAQTFERRNSRSCFCKHACLNMGTRRGRFADAYEIASANVNDLFYKIRQSFGSFLQLPITVARDATFNFNRRIKFIDRVITVWLTS